MFTLATPAHWRAVLGVVACHGNRDREPTDAEVAAHARVTAWVAKLKKRTAA